MSKSKAEHFSNEYFSAKNGLLINSPVCLHAHRRALNLPLKNFQLVLYSWTLFRDNGVVIL